MTSLAKKKCRRYSVEYLAYGFVPSPRDQLLPMCLLCTCSFSNESMKPCKMKKHLLNAHPDYKDKPLEYFLSLKDSFHKRGTLPQIIGQCSQQLDKGILASYKISKVIAQTGNAHNVGESPILPSVSIIMSEVMSLNPRDTVQAIPLSNSTVCRRIDEMAYDIEDQLVALLQSKKFSLQIDETTLQDNDALLVAYQIQKDMEERFHDLVNLNIPDWIIDPFGVSAVEVDAEIQESLIDLQSDTTARRQFDHYGKDFWVKNDLPNKLPALWEKVQIFFIAFPSTYLVECGFRKVAALTKSRNRMDVATRGDLRLSLSNLEPDIMKLAKNCQPQGSH
ncbi:hypothetical protein M513_08900 [Trichuris suis]|uniref:HAT C-terminal dimerisation domain-containing protein n=1 Tax=Trichuris suis TaxID=68888 RepID=A0A085LZ76_9BILA|nr:hypothetical protein M513_08900 [Trichuris suis]